MSEKKTLADILSEFPGEETILEAIRKAEQSATSLMEWAEENNPGGLETYEMAVEGELQDLDYHEILVLMILVRGTRQYAKRLLEAVTELVEEDEDGDGDE